MSFEHEGSDDAFGEALRSAAGDLRQQTDALSIPDFSPRSSGAGPFAAGVAVALLAVAGFFGLRSLGSDDGSGTVDVAGPSTTASPDDNSSAGAATTVQPPNASIIESEDRPPLIGTGTPFVDPDTGALIERLTTADPLGAIAPALDSAATFNPSGSLFILYEQGEGHLLFDGNTLTPIGPINIASDDVYNWSWHPTDPDIVFYPDGDNSNRIIRHNVRTGGTLVAATFDRCNTVGQGFSFGTTANGTGHMGLLCDTDVGRFWAVYNVVTGEFTKATSTTESDAAPIAMNADGSLFVVYDEDATRVLDAALEPTSLDPIPGQVTSSTQLQRSDGAALTVGAYYNEDDGRNGLAIAFDLATGERFGFLDDRTGNPPPGGRLAGTLSGGQIVVSVPEGGEDPLMGNISLVVPGEQPTVLANHRMSPEDYQGHEWGDRVIVAIDPLGRYVLFASDWGTQESTDTFVLRLSPP